MNNSSYVIEKAIIYCREVRNEKETLVCECPVIHQEVIDKIKLPEEEVLYDLGDFFKILGDSTRIKILSALFQSEMCVCDIAALLGMTQSAISHQLRVLKQGRLVKHRKDGKVVYYSLDDDHIKHIVDQGLTHISEKR